MENKAIISGKGYQNNTIFSIEIYSGDKLKSTEKYVLDRRMTENEMMEFFTKIKDYAKTLLLEMGAKRLT